eukprot:TRINITY_DN610_c0_g1_i2.p1 TRINITY_DN610_c0_g1~~TRINITY_DN610_c0_g1_i2.p1  ORF type:complete len:184 (+),score=24.11 TRINITY_DN610_c0_g1_i2:57-608(+)
MAMSRNAAFCVVLLLLVSCSRAADTRGQSAITALISTLNSSGPTGALIAGLISTSGVGDTLANAIDTVGNATVFLPVNSALVSYFTKIANLMALINSPADVGRKLLLINVIPSSFLTLSSISYTKSYPTLLKGASLKFGTDGKDYFVGNATGPINAYAVLTQKPFLSVNQTLIVYRISKLLGA